MYRIPRIHSVFQPIISVSKKSVVGFEGLSRGIDEATQNSVPPSDMFQEAKAFERTVELDRECRQKCIEGFEDLSLINKDYYLFINIEASILEQVGGSDYFHQQIKKAGIPPQNVVIEISEAMICNSQCLLDFIKYYKELGFLISLDDIGAGYSNYERIAMVKPDIIKVDRSIISGMDTNYFKQEVFKSLVSMSNKIGAIVVAEGVETEEEVYSLINCGAHLIQGFFFAKPGMYDQNTLSELNKKVDKYVGRYMKRNKIQLKRNKDIQRNVNNKISILVSQLQNSPYSSWDLTIDSFVSDYKSINVECVYVLDMSGIQISETALVSDACDIRKNQLFRPAKKGSDNSMRRYFYELINLKVKRYVSEPYISHATGRVCKTFSTVFTAQDGKKCIVCVDLHIAYESS